ncbi:hypothetical protein [Hydrogenophaga sp. T2]|uniref:hypothetical protein n=1 Tax=Hydrogenophaga sp. T2 TaxID=3132823 RepID=UPI003CF24757
MKPQSITHFHHCWNTDVASAVAAHLHSPPIALAVDTEDALKTRARHYQSLALTSRSGHTAAAPYLEALHWTHDAQRLTRGGRWAPLADSGVCAADVLSQAFEELVLRPSSVASRLDTARTRHWRAEVLTMRLFDHPDTQAVRAALKACLVPCGVRSNGAAVHRLVDVQALAAVAWSVAWRRQCGTSGLSLALQAIQLGQGVAPARQRALLLVERAVLDRYMHTPAKAAAVRSELEALVLTNADFAPLLAHLDMALRFLNADAASAEAVDPLIDHLLAEDTPWHASDTLLLLHLSHLVVPGDDEDSLHRTAGQERHFQKLNRFAFTAAAQGLLLSHEQAQRVEDAAVRLLQHGASLVPEGEPAHAEAVLALLLPEVRDKALARLTPGERARFGPEEALV